MTDDLYRWIYLDGPEPERLRPLFAALREAARPTPEDKARVQRAFFERLDATLGIAPPAPEPDDPVSASPAPSVASRDDERALPAPAPPVPEALVRTTVEEGTTVRTPALDDRPPAPPAELPPAPPPAPPPVPAAPVAEPKAPARAPAHLAVTDDIAEAVAKVRAKKPTLPFLAPEALPPNARAKRTLQSELTRRGQGETFPVGDDSIARALAALPFVNPAGAAAPARFRELTLEQYASLCAELSVRPEAADRIQKPYGVEGAAGREALHAHWRRIFAERPDLQACFEERLAGFAAWVRAAGNGG